MVARISAIQFFGGGGMAQDFRVSGGGGGGGLAKCPTRICVLAAVGGAMVFQFSPNETAVGAKSFYFAAEKPAAGYDFVVDGFAQAELRSA